MSRICGKKCKLKREPSELDCLACLTTRLFEDTNAVIQAMDKGVFPLSAYRLANQAVKNLLVDGKDLNKWWSKFHADFKAKVLARRKRAIDLTRKLLKKDFEPSYRV